MKRNWLLYLLLFSLAFNLGIIGTLLYWRWQGPRAAAMSAAGPPMPFKELWSCLPLAPEQRQNMRRCIMDHHLQVRTLRHELAQKRRELLDLFRRPSPEWEVIRSKVREVAEKQGRLEEEMVRLLFEMQKNLTPEQRAEFIKLLEQRLPRAMGRGRLGGHRDGGPWIPGKDTGFAPPFHPPKDASR